MAAIWGVGPDGAPPGVEPSDAAMRRPDIVLITVEAMAPGHCSLYGYERDTTPFLRELAKESVVFEEAYSTSSWTRPSVASIFTGVYPSQHGVVRQGRVLSPNFSTLSGILQGAGYTTAAFCTNIHVNKGVFAYQQGFDKYFAPSSQEFDYLPLLAQWLSEPRSKPFFLYMHVFDPHKPYNAPGAFRDMYAGDYSGRLKKLDDVTEDYFALFPMTPAEVEYIKARYDGELAYTDHVLRQVMLLLKRHGSWDNAVVVITSDHGEAMYQHGRFDHRWALYPEQIRVPLVIRRPNAVHGGVRMRGFASGVDLLPTILSAARVEVPQGTEGIDLLRDEASGHTGRDYCYGEFLTPTKDDDERPQSWALVDSDYHFLVIEHHDGPRRELLFDRRTDPGAEHDVAAERAELCKQYSLRLQEIRASLRPGASPEHVVPDEETLRILRELGYR